MHDVSNGVPLWNTLNARRVSTVYTVPLWNILAWMHDVSPFSVPRCSIVEQFWPFLARFWPVFGLRLGGLFSKS